MDIFCIQGTITIKKNFWMYLQSPKSYITHFSALHTIIPCMINELFITHFFLYKLSPHTSCVIPTDFIMLLRIILDFTKQLSSQRGNRNTYTSGQTSVPLLLWQWNLLDIQITHVLMNFLNYDEIRTKDCENRTWNSFV